MALGPQTAQGGKQASIRAVTGFAESYEGDWHRLFDAASIPVSDAGGRPFCFDERLLRWINQKLSAAYVNLPEAQQALATINGAYNFASMGAFDAGASDAPVTGSPGYPAQPTRSPLVS